MCLNEVPTRNTCTDAYQNYHKSTICYCFILYKKHHYWLNMAISNLQPTKVVSSVRIWTNWVEKIIFS